MTTDPIDAVRRIAVLDPRGEAQARAGGANERLSSLDGKTVGILIDGPWRSWYVASEVLEARFRAHGIDTKRLSVNRLEFNSDGLDLDNLVVGHRDRAVDEFASEIDAVVVGLGN